VATVVLVELPVAEFRICSAVLDGDVHVVSVAGELDLHTSGELGEELDDVIRRAPRSVVVDLVGVTFLDSTALGALAAAARRAHTVGARVVVVTDDPHTTKIFRITALDRLIGVRRTLVDALAEAVV
jgi:anti-sigma B factor antagonist